MAIKIAGTEVINDNRELVLAKLTEINTSIADTAVDIFVYDTSKDSDGGAWRKRTQHTSWYNETLNTATRGSRKEFPAVAVIVADNSASELVIYDADDPSLPMWIKWTDVSLGGNKPITSVAMLNGILCWGSDDGNASSGALIEYNFLKETRYYFGWYGNTYRLDNAFADRNGDGTNVIDNSRGQILQQNVNDVAMTVLPNAPIDSATGLPVPTIAVATDGGISVITDSGAVFDITTNSEPDGIVSIAFLPDDRFTFATSNNDSRWWVMDIPTTDRNANYFYQLAQYDYQSNPSSLPDWRNNGVSRGEEGEAVYRADGGLGRVRYEDEALNYTTSSYNTGWMNGDIKLATLSDTDDTNVTGSELVTNGTFDTDTSGWNVVAGTLTYSSGEAVLSNATAYHPYFYQTISVTAGKTYVLSVDITAISGQSCQIRVFTDGSFATTLAVKSSITTTGTHNITFTATGSTHYIRMAQITASSGDSATFDNISVRLAEEDRSVNGNGLQVFGTVTKSAVASGADLVAYSGFSASNYLQQPYNSDLDFGTGDFSIIAWIKQSAYTNNYTCIIDKAEYGTGNNRIEFMFNSSTLRLDVSPNSITSNTGIGVANKWICVAAVRRNGVVSLYADGNLVGSGTASGNVSNSSHKLWVGVNYLAGNAGQDKQLALLRMSATAPSPEQIKRIYEDEKVLFQENAQATLYGSSDAVTALAYDDSTELLHVGTSAGRSVFQGLRRVDNTTTAVGAAISASNGLVADE